MMENKKKKIFCGAAVLILFASISLPMTTAQYGDFLKQKGTFYKPQSLETIDEKEYCVAFGPLGAKNFDECNVIKKLNETAFLSFKKDVEELKYKDLDSEEMIDQQLKLFIKYGITPECFTLENLTDAVEELKTISSKESRGVLDGDPNIQIGRTTIGPHMVIYCSLLSAVVNFQPAGNFVSPRPISDINKIVDIFNISRDSALYDILYNVTIFRYLHYAPLNVLIGGSLGCYLSIGLFPGVQTYEIVNNPFVGVYIVWFGGGIYIYEGHDNSDDGVDNALFDFFIGLTPFSMVTYREFSNPTP